MKITLTSRPLNISVLLLGFLLYLPSAYPQYKFRYDNYHPVSVEFAPEKQNGFRASLSLVALFTSGVADRSGFRIGAGLKLSQTIDDWTLSLGLDAYKAARNFGIGTAFVGPTFRHKEFETTYFLTKYFQGDRQMSGIVHLEINDFKFSFEDDILAYPFTGFKIYDRFRTAALEMRYKGFMIGTNVYTTDIDGVTDVLLSNQKGEYRSGQQISSPVYVGYARRDLMLRYGINSKLGGFLGQNGWHELLFGTPNFRYGDYKSQFIQIGVDKPYTLY